MSPGEVVWRLRRAVSDRVLELVPDSRKPASRQVNAVLEPWPGPSEHCDPGSFVELAEKILAGQAEMFGQWVELGTPVNWNRDPLSGVESPMIRGSRLDYRDKTVVGSARNTWELNRHLQLVTLGQAWSLTKDERYRDAGCRTIASWVESCPYPLGINWVSALEHGIRLINWYLAARLFAFRIGDEVPAAWLESIYDHCRFVWAHRSRYSSANNHLIGEMAGLYVASLAWPHWPQSEAWRRKARKILEHEALEQVHADGVTKEQTTGYQPFIIQFLVIAGLVGEASGEPFSREYWQVTKRMIEFLKSVRSVNGSVPSFGDADEGIVYSLSPAGRSAFVDDLIALADRWCGAESRESREAPATVSWLATAFPSPSNWPSGQLEQRMAFPDGGYYLLGSDFDGPDEVKIVVDAGPLGYLSIAAHGHADCLSFTLSIAGHPILIDPGTYSYHEDPAWRDYFRGTPAHNTVTVDGVSQSVMGGPFMWLHKAVASNARSVQDGSTQSFSASHNGYCRLDDPVTHERRVDLSPADRSLSIVDIIKAKQDHIVDRHWHFSPECHVARMSDTAVTVKVANIEMRCTFEKGVVAEVFRGSDDPFMGWCSPRFGELASCPSLRLRADLHGSGELVTNFQWTLS